MSLAEKVVVITGSTRGIGRAIAEECARRGATVVVSSRSADAVDATVGALAALSPHGATAISGIPADVSRYDDVVALRDHAIATHGRIDVWLNNAGVSNGYRPLDEESPEEIEALIAINLLGHMYSATGGHPVLPRARRLPHEHVRARLEGRRSALHDRLRREQGCDRLAHEVPRRREQGLRERLGERVRAGDGRHRLLRRHHVQPAPRGHEGQHPARARRVRDAACRRWAGAAPTCSRPSPATTTGKIYALLKPSKMMRGGMKMAWWGMTGKMARG